jgi:hypothetical protein
MVCLTVLHLKILKGHAIAAAQCVEQNPEREVGVQFYSAQQLCWGWVESRHMQDDVIDTSAFANAAASL